MWRARYGTLSTKSSSAVAAKMAAWCTGWSHGLTHRHALCKATVFTA